MTLALDYIRNQLKKGYSPIILIVGKQRVGKTALALRLAFELNPKFDIEKEMFFEIEKFASCIHKCDNKVLLLDEAGITLDPYEHMSVTQRVYNHIIQTQAYKKNVIFLILPFASEIGKTHRKHVSGIIEVIWRGGYKFYSASCWHSDLSYKPPRLTLIEQISGVPLPPKHIWENYIEFGQKVYKEQILNLQIDILAKKKIANTQIKQKAINIMAMS